MRGFFLAPELVAVPAAAQTGLGEIRGTVQDATKAVIPNAKVTLTNTATGIAREGQSNEQGIYYFGAVPIGPYKVLAQAPGFTNWEGTLTLRAGETAVIDPAMVVGTTATTAEVTSAAPVIATEGAQVSDVKDALSIHNLPLNGRQITTLFHSTPGLFAPANPRTNRMKVDS